MNTKETVVLNHLRLTIRKPSKIRRSFSITRDLISTNGKRSQATWESKDIDLINQKYRQGNLAFDQAIKLLEVLKEKELEKFNGPKLDRKFNQDNKSVVLAHLDKMEKARIKSKDGRGAKAIDKASFENIKVDCDRILRLLGEDSLTIIPRDALLERLESLKGKAGTIYKYSVRQKILSRLNLLLKEVGRSDEDLLSKSELLRDEVDLEREMPISFITKNELPCLIKAAEGMEYSDIIKDCMTILFHTGMREGELFAITAKSWSEKSGTYLVQRQRNREWKLKEPKNNRQRHVLVPTEAVDAFKRWVEYDQEVLKTLRLKLSRLVKRIALKVWPDNIMKQVSNHDLRHSAAIWYLTRGLSLTSTSKFLGHSEEVCRMHYAGWITTDEEASLALKKLGGF